MLRWRAGASSVAPAPAPPSRALPHHRLAPRAAARRRLLRPCSAKKAADDGGDRAGGSSLLSKSVLLRSGVALFALGFVDAGYSGDWSRVGAISKDTEELLKKGAYLVVPLSLALIFSLSDDSSSKR